MMYVLVHVCFIMKLSWPCTCQLGGSWTLDTMMLDSGHYDAGQWTVDTMTRIIFKCHVHCICNKCKFSNSKKKFTSTACACVQSFFFVGEKMNLV